MGQYDNLSKEELLKLIKKQELDLKSKKYGLVWDYEKEPEQVVLDCRDNLPILKRVKSKEIKEPKDNTQEDNILIEGDNYHGLTVLNYTHQEKIDVIYIDPPYNTGKKNEWKYNDCYVDENDGYRHSKWLNFMEKRLKLAKELLKKEGVIFISIDDHEVANLKLLCNQIFSPNNFIGQITREAIKGGSQSSFIREVHDFVLIYAKNIDFANFSGFEQDGIELNLEDENGKYAKGRELNKWGAGSRKEDAPGMHFPIKGPNNEDIYPIRNDGSEGRWRLGKKSMLKKVSDGDVIFEKRENGTYIVYEKIRDNSPRIKQFTTLFSDGYINSKGSETLKKIFGTLMSVFDYAKPVELIHDLLIMSNTQQDAIVLDFFAGSGTTAQAVLELNKEDEGNRKFILCTNNENNICTEITYPRVEKVIKGYEFKGKDKTILFEKKLTWTVLSKKFQDILKEINEIIETNKDTYDEIKKEFKNNTLKIIGIKNIDGKKEGVGGNLQYFKTSLLQQTKNRDQTKINFTQKCSEVLCLKENIFNIEVKEEDYKIFSANDNKKFLCIYFNFIDESFKNFLEKVKGLGGEKIIYMFSLEDKIDSSLFKEINNCSLEAIPKNILEVYKKLVKMNIPIRAETIFIDLDKAKKQVFEDKDKDTGAKTLRVVLEKLVQKIAQKNQINILTDKGKEIKLSTLNDTLKTENVISKLEWEENKTYLTIGNHASHGEYDEFDLTQVNKFYKHIQTLINRFNI
jgi:adenine-specific DNA-methyltransferase